MRSLWAVCVLPKLSKYAANHYCHSYFSQCDDDKTSLMIQLVDNKAVTYSCHHKRLVVKSTAPIKVVVGGQHKFAGEQI